MERYLLEVTEVSYDVRNSAREVVVEYCEGGDTVCGGIAKHTRPMAAVNIDSPRDAQGLPDLHKDPPVLRVALLLLRK